MTMTVIRVMHFRREVPTGGGPETLIADIARQIDRSSFSLCISILTPRGDWASPLLDSVRAADTPAFVLPACHRFDPTPIFRLARLLDEHEVDILHTHDHRTNLIGYLATRLRPTALACTLHQPLRRHWWLRHFEILDDLMVRRFDRLLPVAEAIRQEVLAKRPDLADRVVTVLNGVDVDRFTGAGTGAAVRDEFRIPDHTVLCATIGRLSDDKGLMCLLDAARKVRDRRDDVFWLVAGRGPLADDFRKRIKEMGLDRQVVLAGYRTDVPELLAAADMLVVASTSEGCPVVVLEAMAAGVPVIATRVGGTPEVVRDQTTGLIVPPGRSDLIADAVDRLAQSRECRQAMGHAGAQRVRKELSVTHMVRRLEEVYTGMISG